MGAPSLPINIDDYLFSANWTGRHPQEKMTHSHFTLSSSKCTSVFANDLYSPLFLVTLLLTNVTLVIHETSIHLSPRLFCLGDPLMLW